MTSTRNNEYTIRDEVSPNTRIHERTNSSIVGKSTEYISIQFLISFKKAK
jgi:hypothetical protein